MDITKRLNAFLKQVKLDLTSKPGQGYYANNQFKFYLKAGLLRDNKIGVEVVAPKSSSESADAIAWNDYYVLVELDNEPITQAYFSEFDDGAKGNINLHTKLIARAVFPETSILEPGLNYTLKIVPRLDPSPICPPREDISGNSLPTSPNLRLLHNTIAV